MGKIDFGEIAMNIKSGEKVCLGEITGLVKNVVQEVRKTVM